MYWRVLFSCLDDYDDYFDYNDYNDYDKGSLRIRKVQFFYIVQTGACSKIMLWILYNTKGPLAA